jgi:hypothetical protein
MPFAGIADSEQLTSLAAVLDDYCREACIEPSTSEYDWVAGIIMALFNNGIGTADELKAALHFRLESVPDGMAAN